MTSGLTKDESLLDVLSRLRADLGKEAFLIRDHWDADLCAVGIERPGPGGQLVYISTWQRPAGSYYVELEVPADSGASYEVAARFDSVEYSELLELVRGHLLKDNPPGLLLVLDSSQAQFTGGHRQVPPSRETAIRSD